jgi:hypothetical protein
MKKQTPSRRKLLGENAEINLLGDSDQPRKETTIKEPTRPVSKTDKINVGLRFDEKEPETHKMTLIIQAELHKKLKELAYYEQDLLKNVAHRLFENAIAAHEKKHGILPEVPQDKIPKNYRNPEEKRKEQEEKRKNQ